MFSKPSRMMQSTLLLLSLSFFAGCERERTLRAADGAVGGESVPANLTQKSDTKDEGMQTHTEGDLQTATFGAGCFWGVESVFRQVPGVVDAAVGYSGGAMKNPTYKDVCTDRTGHAEVIQIQYDPKRVTYEKLLNIFWKSHDPTQVNRQGPDVGTQYRSVIFYHTPEQKAAAEASKKALEESHKHRRPIATAIEPAGTFYRAEEYHQQYLSKHGMASCHVPSEDD